MLGKSSESLLSSDFPSISLMACPPAGHRISNPTSARKFTFPLELLCSKYIRFVIRSLNIRYATSCEFLYQLRASFYTNFVRVSIPTSYEFLHQLRTSFYTNFVRVWFMKVLLSDNESGRVGLHFLCDGFTDGGDPGMRRGGLRSGMGVVCGCC